MQAALITGKHQLELREFPEPDPVAGGVVVAIAYCGVCGTDVHAYAYGLPYPAALCGHEWAGAVSKAGRGVTSVQEGDRVSVSILPPCGECNECRAGHTEWCVPAMNSLGGGDPLGTRAHGGFAPSIAVSAERVAPVPGGLSDEAAAQVEPATVAFHGVRRSRLRLGDFAVVQGAGPIGLFALQWVVAGGAREVIVSEPSAARRKLARELGASQVCAPDEIADVVEERTRGLGADIVFECVGRPETIQGAANLCRRGAGLTIIGLSHQSASIDPGIWLSKELRVHASIAYCREEFEQSIAMLADGRVRTEPLHTRTIGLGELDAVVAELAAGDAQDTKVLVDPRQ
jgi:(R,R)-butanediol dehydrogenase/meso-butanediol dehydrogenase/diacetyl reductase